MEPGSHIRTPHGASLTAECDSRLIPVLPLSGISTISIEYYEGLRQPLRWLFQLAEDSDAELDRYIEFGHVFVARTPTTIVGYIQVTAGETSKIVSVAVANSHRRQGIGTALIRTGLMSLFSAGAARVLVATAAADLDNLRLYQRLGFRFLEVERDAFTADRGYSATLNMHGIPIRDRVWLSIEASNRADVPSENRTGSTKEGITA